MNLYQPIRILNSTVASASPSLYVKQDQTLETKSVIILSTAVQLHLYGLENASEKACYMWIILKFSQCQQNGIRHISFPIYSNDVTIFHSFRYTMPLFAGCTWLQVTLRRIFCPSLLLQLLLLLLLLHLFNGLLSRITWVSRYQKGKTSLDLNEARDDAVLGWQWHQTDYMQTIYTSLQTDNHTNTSSLNFYRTCSSRRPTNSVKALK